MAGVGIVVDGRERALAGARERVAESKLEIEAAVESEYRSRIARAGVLRRAHLRFRMRHEIKRRLAQAIEKMAPRGGLYAARG